MFTQRKYFELKKVRYKVTLYECDHFSNGFMQNQMTENVQLISKC